MLGRVKVFPFEARLCRDCLLGFNASRLTGRELRFIYDNYLYISPMRGIGRSKYEGMLNTLKKYYGKKDSLVEVGCSEGYLLSLLKGEGYTNLTGIEPGPQAEQAREYGLNVIRGYFDENTFEGKSVDGFFLMHVFEHFDDPFSILEAMKKQLSRQGKIVIEVPDFGGYHHQHLFFYNLPFLKRLSWGKGLKIIEKETGQGALRVVMVHRENDGYKEIKSQGNSDGIIDLSKELYRDFKKTVRELNRFLKSKKGSKVYWWGAGSSSVSFLNQIHKDVYEEAGLSVVDGDKNKWGKYIPGLNIKVQPFKILSGKRLDTLIIASEFHREIMETCKANGILADNVRIFF